MLTFTSNTENIFTINPKKAPHEISTEFMKDFNKFLKIEPLERSQLQETIDSAANIFTEYECDVRIVCISDTHSKIPNADQLPRGDILIHAGDLLAGWKTGVFKPHRIEHFKRIVQQLADLPFQHIILTPGNHDKMLDKNCHAFDQGSLDYIKNTFPKIKFLVNEELVIKLNVGPGLPNQQIKVYASPTVCYRNHPVYTIEDQKPIYAHALERGSTEISDNWKKIPDDIDILVTHGPPLGVGDLNKQGDHCGCADLLHEIVERVKPRVHVFGHIHECAGQVFKNEDTVFINAGVLDQNYDQKKEEAVSFKFKFL